MAKVVGRNAALYVDDSGGSARCLSGATNSTTLTITPETAEVTAWGHTTRRRIDGNLLDWELSISGLVDFGANKVEPVLTGIIGSSTVIAFGPAGSATGNRKYAASAMCEEMSVETPVEGVVTYDATFTARSGSLTKTTWAAYGWQESSGSADYSGSTGAASITYFIPVVYDGNDPAATISQIRVLNKVNPAGGAGSAKLAIYAGNTPSTLLYGGSAIDVTASGYITDSNVTGVTACPSEKLWVAAISNFDAAYATAATEVSPDEGNEYAGASAYADMWVTPVTAASQSVQAYAGIYISSACV